MKRKGPPFPYFGMRRVFATVVLMLLCVCIVWLSVMMPRFSSTSKKSDQFDDIIIAAAKRHSLDPMLIKAVIWQESRFDPAARGDQGEIGLMQVRRPAVLDWAANINCDEPCVGIVFNPLVNIEIGSWYLANAKSYWDRYAHKDELALSTYNAGLKPAQKWVPFKTEDNVLERITYPGTRRYVASIMSKYSEYKKEQESR